MKYLKEDDNRYRVRFMRATEELMDRFTVAQFITYLEENAELESDEEYEYIGGNVVKCKAYNLKEAGSNLHKEFLVTEDGRLFFWLSLNTKIELVDPEVKKESIRKEKDEEASMKKETAIRKLRAEVRGMWWTRFEEMNEDLEELGYEIVDSCGERVWIVDPSEEDVEIALRIGQANTTIWIDDVA